MTIAKDLKQAKDHLFEQIHQHLLDYETETGLVIDEITIVRPFGLIGVSQPAMTDIKVRTNANSLT